MSDIESVVRRELGDRRRGPELTGEEQSKRESTPLGERVEERSRNAAIAFGRVLGRRLHDSG